MSRDSESRRLAERIYNAFPVSEPSFAKLLALLDVEATDAIATACVTTGARSRLCLNPAYVRAMCHTDTDLVMLVLHELYHVVLGHTRLFPRITPAQNWAFDAVINAQLCLLFPQPHQTAFFRRCFPADNFPLAMLRPPDGWRTPQERWALDGEAGVVHRALYSDTSVSYKQLYDLLPRLLGDHAGSGAGVGDGKGFALADLLGDHAGEDALPPDLAVEVRGIVARWPMVERRSGRDQGAEPEEAQVRRRAAQRRAVAIIRRAIATLADRHADGSTRSGHVDWAPFDATLPYRTRPDRRAEVREALGETALLHRAALRRRARIPGERVHVYVDVSGSMDAVLRGLYAALVPLLDCVEPAIHLFSTKLVDVSHGQLRRGIAVTTGGTEIASVTAHLLAHRVRRAVVLTDGWVGRIPSAHVVRMKAAGVRLGAVVTDKGDPNFVTPVGGRAWRLPNLETSSRATQ